MSEGSAAVLAVEDLAVGFDTDDRASGAPRPVVEDVGFAVGRGRTLALVGESGCGKTVTALAVLGLLPSRGRVERGTIRLLGEDLTALDEGALAAVRGNRAAMIFQEPMSALNPVFRVGPQVAEPLRLHRGLGRAAALDRAVELLTAVGIPDPRGCAARYPHELSGGMRQRVMIAMALACEPDLLIADEPTTALDVTIQAQILDLMLDMQERLGMAMLFISHDFGVVSRIADDVAVMYGGRLVERASAGELLSAPAHPYTRALLATTPRLDAHVARLPAIPGRVPPVGERPSGCGFAPRCAQATARCRAERPALRETAPGRQVACHLVS